MRIDISLIFAAEDREVAREVAHRLEQGAQARVWLEEVREPVNETWDQGMASAGVVLLLSPDSVPTSAGREDWAGLLAYTGVPPVARLLVRPCAYPRLLERSLFFQWSDPDVLRKLHRWAIRLHGDEPLRPAATTYEGSTEELWLWLADRPGVMRVDDLAQARQFAHESADWFRDVMRVPCAGRSLPMIVGEIALSMGIKLHGTLEDACELVSAALADARVLLLLEGMETDAPFFVEGEASVLYAPAGEPEPAPALRDMVDTFVHWSSRGSECAVYVPHVEQAVSGGEWNDASRLGRAAFSFLKEHERLFEAAHIASVVLHRTEQTGDENTANWAREELSWIMGGDRVRTPKPPMEQLSLLFA